MNGQVLVVDGDERARDDLSGILLAAGYDVIQCGTVKTAFVYLDMIDLSCVVLDLHLPNGHGRRVVEDLKAKRDDVPVVVLSSFHSEDEWEFPVVSVLEKPLKKDALLDAVSKAVKHAVAIREIKDSTRRMKNFTGVI